MDFTIEDNCYVKDTFIGTTVSKKITVNILNPDNSINLENKTIEVYIGIYIDGKLEEIPYGTYIIEKPNNEEVKEKTSFTGYDYMIKFNVPYVHDDTIIYPIKLSILLEKLCNQVGLELGNIDFINNDYMVLGNPFTNNEDCRTVLSNIAQLAGGFAKIGRDNKVYIKTLKKFPDLVRVKDVHNMPVKDLHVLPVYMLSTYKDNTDEELDGNNYFDDFSKNEQWGNVNSLVLSISDIEGENTARTDEASIAKNGLTEITIADNYFLINQEEREKVINSLWENLNGIRYLPFKTKYYGYPHLDSGDAIAIEDTQNVQYITYVFNHTFIFNGAFDGKLETTAMTKTQTAYKNTQDTKLKIKRAERKIDKINGVIEDILEEQTETESKLSQHQQTIDSITDKVSSVTEELNTTKEELKGDIEQVENDINKNLQDNYYTKTETNSQITQKADSIVSEVNKSISTAKQEAIDSANTNTDDRLKEYTKTTDMNSKIEQTAENITSEVSTKYSTKEETEEAKQEAITSSNSTTDSKLKDYTKTVDMNSAIEQKADSITSSVNKTIEEAKEEAIETSNSNTDEKLKKYSTTTEMESKITQKANEISSTVSETYSTKEETNQAKEDAISSSNTNTDNKLKSYSTTSQMNSAIKQSADSITTEVNKKVDNNEWGTKLQQSAEDIRIAWNNISQYIQFISASLRIMDSNDKKLLQLDRYGLYFYDTDGSTNKMILSRSGQQFYEGGEYVGLIGTNGLKGYSGIIGLNFDLDTRGSYMTWASKEPDYPDVYALQFYYARPNTGGLQSGLNLGTHLNLNGGHIKICNDTDLVQWGNGGAGIRTATQFTIGDNVNVTFLSIANGKVNCYRNLDMNGYDIINAGNVASDGRLKKSIYSSSINAIDRIKQMKHRQFRWKKDNKQEEIGYIAQEMEKIDSNYVRHNYEEDEKGNVKLDTYEMRVLPILATATKAIQEQQEIIEKQQKQINMLMEKLNIQQDIPHEKEVFIEEPEIIFSGEVINKGTEILEPAPKYKTIMRRLDNGEVEIYKELEEDK